MIRNSQMVVNIDKAIAKWKPIVEKMNITDPEKIAALCEHAEIYSNAKGSEMVRENVAYANPANTAGMGAVVQPGINGIPGQPGTAGSGDLGQTLLPASLKIAAHTPGLDLLPMINVNSNRVDLLYFDFKYDDVANVDAGDERSSSIKIRPTADVDFNNLVTFLRAEMIANGVTELRGRLSKPLYFHISDGVTGVQPAYDATVAPGATKTGWVQFKGFSRIDGIPMFRVYIQQNSASSGGWAFNTALNTFAATGALTTILSASEIDETATSGAAQPFGAVGAGGISLVSVNEDLIDDFTTARGASAMARDTWEADEAGKIGPDSFVKSVQIGVAHVSAAIRLSEMGDFKRMYGVDIVEKTKAQLVNQIQQKISTEIVEKVKEMGLKNRLSTPNAPTGLAAGLAGGGITDGRIYDMSVTATAAALGGEHNASVARKLWAKVMQASMYIHTDGRIGMADFVVTSGTVISILRSITGYAITPFDVKLAPGQLHPAGTVDGVKLYVDPYMSPADLTVFLGRKGTNEDPGLKFLAYMLAETVEIVSEKTMAPRLYMYSRYAVTEFGHYPEKQYMAVKVEDKDGILY